MPVRIAYPSNKPLAAGDAITTRPQGLTGMDMLATALRVVQDQTSETLKALIVSLFCSAATRPIHWLIISGVT